MCQPFVSYPHRGQAERVSYASVVHSKSKISQLRTKTRLLKEENWREPSSLIVQRFEQLVDIALYKCLLLLYLLLVWIVAYKLSRIYYFSLNSWSVETCRFEVTAFGLIKLQRHQKSQLLLSTLSKKKGLFITAVAFFYSWGDRSSTHPLGYAINWFRFGKLLNTTNGVRFSIVIFSWQPLLNLLICRFIYSVRLRSKLNGKKYSHIVLRNRWLITERESDHVPRRRKEYM